MNLNKARDFYSAYYEGSLDEGLKQAFERAMSLDAQVGAEYSQFVRIMEELKGMAIPVEVPSDLHLKIRDRVDAHIQAAESKSKAASWFFGWKPIAYGAVATVAIISAVVSISSFGNRSGVSTASVSPIVDTAPRLEVRDGTLVLSVAAKEANTVSIVDHATGKTVFSQSLIGQRLESPLTNGAKHATVVNVRFSREFGQMTVGLPGKRIDSSLSSGKGTVEDMVRALAGMYAAPVVLSVPAGDQQVAWKFEGTDALSASADELKVLGLQAEVHSGGLVWISSSN